MLFPKLADEEALVLGDEFEVGDKLKYQYQSVLVPSVSYDIDPFSSQFSGSV